MIGLIPYVICLLLLAAAFVLLPHRPSLRRTAAVLLVLSVLGEVFICNFHSFHLPGGGYEPTEVDLKGESVSLSGGIVQTPEGTGITVKEGGLLNIHIRELDRPVGTVHVRLRMTEDCPGVTAKISAKDETHSASMRAGVAEELIVSGDPRSAWIVLDLSGKVGEMRLVLTAPDHAAFTLEGVTLNTPVPMRFSALRLVLFVLGFLAVYSLLTHPSMKKTYGEGREPLRSLSFVLTLTLLAGAVFLTWISRFDTWGTITAGFTSADGNQITKELVDAFRLGQVHLTEEPPQALLELENPYDWSQRIQAGVDYRWDHLLYEGKYYSYYGIAPVLLLFLPYNLITGFYFPTAEAILLFGGLGIIFLTLLFLELAELFGKSIPNGILLGTLLILQASSGVWFTFAYDNFYEIAQSSGFLFTCAGFFFLLKSRIIGEGKIRHLHLTLATICLSWAVLCRPTLALYCVVACIFIAFGLVKRRGEVKEALPDVGSVQKKALRSAAVKYLLAALTPFVLIGGIQVIYNVARFGNPMDFGIRYSLTINDFTGAQYHTDFVMIGLFNYLLAFPRIHPAFPYIASNFSDLSVNGYYFVANENAIGLFWRALPSLGYLGIVPAWRILSKKEKTQALCLLLPLCVLTPLIIIASVWESGYGVRYCADFSWPFILGGTAVLYLLYSRVARGQGRTVLRWGFGLAAVLSVAANGALLYEYLPKSGFLAADYLRFARLFDFWM